MAKHSPHLESLHPILRRSAEAQILYGFVVGATTADETLSIRRAIIKFKSTFEVSDLDVNSAIRKFNRMRGESLRDHKILT